jgi:hypothetical protein
MTALPSLRGATRRGNYISAMKIKRILCRHVRGINDELAEKLMN